MTYALIIVDKDHPNNPWPYSMHPVLYGAQPDEGVTRLNEGAWLVRLDSSLLFLSNLIRIAHEEKLPHRVLFFDKEPSFVATKQPPGK